jgi:predicted transport protein
MPSNVDEMANSMLQNLEDKTGKNLDQWIEIVDKSQVTKHKEIINYLKSKYGLTYGYANLIALKTREAVEGTPPSGASLVDVRYSGNKSALRPIYEAIIESVVNFGEDVKIAPKKAYVSLRRSKQFAIVQPSTKTRVDVGINLKGTESSDRLEPSGSFNAMVSHRVRLTKTDQVDDELTQWLKNAYEAA